MNETRVSPADLLRMRRVLGSWEEVREIAGAVGYTPQADQSGSVKLPLPPGKGKPGGEEPLMDSQGEDLSEVKPPDYGGDRRYLQFVLPVYRKTLAAPSAVRPGSGYAALTDEQIALPKASAAVESLPLVPWARLQAFFRMALGRQVSGGRLDVRRLVRDLATGRAVEEIPRLLQQSATGRAVLILDFSDEAYPFWRDFGVLAERLLRERGKSSLRILELQGKSPLSLRERIPPGAPVMVVGTMGLYQQREGRIGQDWVEFGQWLKERGQAGYALLPVPRRRWCPVLSRVWNCVCWDAWERIPHRGGLRACPGDGDHGSGELLTRLSTASRIPFALAREMRLSLGCSVDVGAEYEAWNHEDTWHCNLSFGLSKGKAGDYLKRLERVDEEERGKGAQIIKRHHESCSKLRRLEVLLRQLHVGVRLSPEQEDEIETLLWGVVQRLRNSEPLSAAELSSGIPAWVEDTLQRFPAEMRGMKRFREPLARALALTHRWKNEENHAWLPGTDLEAAQDELRKPDAETRIWYLREEGNGIRFSSDPGEGFSMGRIRAGEWLDVIEGGQGRRIGLVDDLFVGWESEALLLHSVAEQVGFLKVARPAWAGKMARSRQCWLAETEDSISVRWKEPDEDGLGEWVTEDNEKLVNLEWNLDSMLPVEWKVGSREEVRGWADRGGEDEFGRYAVWVHQGVGFRFRWIPPGEFLMGSSEDEKGRWDDEGPQHEVKLTQGYWMLETPVTQEQWMANGEKNPSHFKGAKKPVEQVSWDECQRWLEELTDQLSGVEARLPTEAEWEYACRAGTASAFNNGEDCTEPTGKDPALESLGWYGKNSDSQTQEVGEKEPNAWGLFDMHGNVNEWCQDNWRDQYLEGLQVDPKGPKGGSLRVRRGGCWINNARGCRSAFRLMDGPDGRYGNTGFRFVLQAGSRQGKQGGARSGPAKGAPPGGEKAGQGRAEQGGD